MSKDNKLDTREAWLRALTNLLRPYFEKKGYPLPDADKIRFGIAFTSAGKKGNRVGECWHPAASADGCFEIFIRPDQAEPMKVAGILFHELLHTVLPADAGHGELFKAAARALGLAGPMRSSTPNEWMCANEIAPLIASLSPLPHAELLIARGISGLGVIPADRSKPQKNRYLKARCEAEGCPYNVRLVASCIAIGPPHCPLHGAMTVDAPRAAGDEGGE
jgi:hypothetical protein